MGWSDQMISIVPDSNHSGFSDSALPKAWKHQEIGNCFLPHYLCLGKLIQAVGTPMPLSWCHTSALCQ